MKKTLALIIALATTVGAFSGCSSKTSTGSATTSTVDTQKPITLTMMVSGTKATTGADFILDTLPKEVKKAFPSITLETTKLPDEQYQTSIKTKLAAGEAPDIFLVWPKSSICGVNDLAKAGYLMDLSGYNFWNNFSKGSVDDLAYNGKSYAIANGTDILGTYYNKDLLKKVGITSEPQDWPSFLATCQKLKDAGITPIVLGDKDPWVVQFGLYQIAANVVYPGDMDFDKNLQAGKESLTNPKWIKAISMYQELYTKGYVAKNTLGLSSSQAIQQFIDGKAAMTFDGTWDYTAITAKGAVDFERGFMPIAANDSGKPTFVSASTSAGYAVNAKTKNADSVKKVLELLYDGKSSMFQAWRDSNTSVSVFNGVALNHDLNKGLYDIYKKGNSVYFCNQMWPGAVASEMEAKFAEIIGAQKATPEDVAKAMDAKFKELWKN